MNDNRHVCRRISAPSTANKLLRERVDCLSDVTIRWPFESSLVAVLLSTYSVFNKIEITGRVMSMTVHYVT